MSDIIQKSNIKKLINLYANYNFLCNRNGIFLKLEPKQFILTVVKMYDTSITSSNLLINIITEPNNEYEIYMFDIYNSYNLTLAKIMLGNWSQYLSYF